jgi:hypothetical protein
VLATRPEQILEVSDPRRVKQGRKESLGKTRIQTVEREYDPPAWPSAVGSPQDHSEVEVCHPYTLIVAHLPIWFHVLSRKTASRKKLFSFDSLS